MQRSTLFGKDRLSQTYSGKLTEESAYENIAVLNEDYATVLLRFENGAHGSLTVNQVAAGRKNRLFFEIYGSKMSVAFDSESPNELWIGHRDHPNQILIRDPSLVYEQVRRSISYPGEHNEGFADASKQTMRHFYNHVISGDYLRAENPQFATFEAGLREAKLCEAIVSSAQTESWISV